MAIGRASALSLKPGSVTASGPLRGARSWDHYTPEMVMSRRSASVQSASSSRGCSTAWSIPSSRSAADGSRATAAPGKGGAAL